MKTTTLRKLNEQLAGAYWSDPDSSGNHESYGFLADLVRDLDDREDYNGAGRLPSEADREFRVVERDGEFLLFPAESTEPRYVVMTSEAFSSRFEM